MSGVFNEAAHLQLMNNSDVTVYKSEHYAAAVPDSLIFFRELTDESPVMITGRLPEKNEVLIPDDYYGAVPESVGTTEKYLLTTSGEKFPADLKISGIYMSAKLPADRSADISAETDGNVFYINKETADMICTAAKSDNGVYAEYLKVKNKANVYLVKRNIEKEYGVNLIEHVSSYESNIILDIFFNIMLLMMMLFCIFIIKNIISVKNEKKLREYGVLMALGTRPKKLLILGTAEMVILTLLTIPAAVLSAVLWVNYIFGAIHSEIVSILGIDGATAVNLIRLTGIVNGGTLSKIIIASLITIIYSSWSPFIRLSMLTPYEALSGKVKRLFFSANKNKDPVMAKKHPVLWLSVLNIKRDKGQLFSFGLIMSVIIIIFLFTMHFLSYIAIASPGNLEYDTVNIEYWGEGGTEKPEECFDKAKNIEGIEDIRLFIPERSIVTDREYHLKLLFKNDIDEMQKYVIKGSLEDIYKKTDAVAVLDNKSEGKLKIGDKFEQPISGKNNDMITKTFEVACILKDPLYSGDGVYTFVSPEFYNSFYEGAYTEKTEITCKKSETGRVIKELEKIYAKDFMINKSERRSVDVYPTHLIMNSLKHLITMTFLFSVYVLFMLRYNYILKRKNEVGILTAIGMSRRKIRKMFFYESLISGALFTAAGIIGGVIAVYFLHTNTFRIPFSGTTRFSLPLFTLISALCLAVSFLSMLLPYMLIERENTVDIIRNDE
jgi:ABC-type antimicrobial peptide transport system permease subunit